MKSYKKAVLISVLFMSKLKKSVIAKKTLKAISFTTAANI